MPELVDHVAYLSQEIGPRPAGTEEEQQAALYITEQMQKEAGLSAVIEDFNGASDPDLARMICCGSALVVTAIALFVPVLGVVSIVVTLVAALLFAAEAFDRPFLSKALSRGVSQNVVAKYDPGYSAEAGGSRRRKVILVAGYDSGKVRAELAGPLVQFLPIVQWATLAAMVLLPIFLVFRDVVFLNAEGAVAVFLNVLVVIALVLVAIPLVLGLLHKFAAYNEGANCNASGTAVLLDVARRVGRGRVSEAELAAHNEATIHGEAMARAAGLVPEGAELLYETEGLKPPELAPQTPEARLAAAKAAVAALTGTPVAGAAVSDIAQNLVQIKEPPLPQPSDEEVREMRGEALEAFATIPPDTMQVALDNAALPAQPDALDSAIAPAPYDAVSTGIAADEAPDFAAAGTFAAAAAGAGAGASLASMMAAPASADVPSDDIPDWFKKAQEKAKRPRLADKPVQRSRYASALDAAVRESAGHFAEANTIVEQRLEQQQEASLGEIHEIKAPNWCVASEGEPVAGEIGTQGSLFVEGDGAPGAAAAPGAASGELGGAQVSVPSPTSAAAPVAESDPFSTSAMPPIDVNELRLDGVSPVGQPSLPAFLDPRKVQEDARAAQPEDRRTDERVDVTDVAIGDSGRIEYDPSYVGAAPQGERPPRGPIVLPDIGVAAAKPAPIAEISKQRAPLADVENAGQTAAKSLLTMLPSIDLASPEDAAASDDASADNASAHPAPAAAGAGSSLRAVLPSLSGSLARSGAAEGKSTNVNAAGSFVPAGATGAFAPVGDELLENVDPDDIYVNDADDSAYDEGFTEMGAFAGPGYVEMPKSRARRLFDRFRRKKKDPEPSAQEWLDVDEQFDARTVGAQRGGWESFRGEEAASGDVAPMPPMADQAEDFGDEPYGAFDDGAYGGPDQRFESPGQRFENDSYGEGDDFDADDVDEFSPSDRRPWNGGAFSARRMESSDLDSEALAEESAHVAELEAPVTDELQQIYQFRNPDVNTEVWFVSLGSELAQNSGMRAFLAEHQQDLRGAIIVDLEALGAGDLSMIEQEGRYRSVKTSSRMNRYVKKASQATGLSIGKARMLWGDSSASFAIKQGHQAMHLAGMDGAKPARFAQGDDVLENIDEETLAGNSDFVMELLKNI